MPARLNHAGTVERVRSRILVRGAVQGVGFRPFVHRQATALGLTGWVINSSQGVVVEAEGDPERIAALVKKISEGPPANSTVEFRRDMRDRSTLGRWVRDPGKRRGRRVYRAGAARLCDLRRLPRRALRSVGPPLPLPFHQLYALRAALQHHRRHSLRSGADLDAAVCDVSGLPHGIRQSGRPALPRRAQCLRRLRPAYCAVGRHLEQRSATTTTR